MHEYPITEQIIKIAGEHCKKSGGSRVTKVNLVIGDYSGYVGESVQMYFDIISQDTICEGAVVYYFRYGEAYHEAGCSTIEKYVVNMDRRDAEKRGYLPCSKCGGK